MQTSAFRAARRGRPVESTGFTPCPETLVTFANQSTDKLVAFTGTVSCTDRPGRRATLASFHREKGCSTTEAFSRWHRDLVQLSPAGPCVRLYDPGQVYG